MNIYDTIKAQLHLAMKAKNTLRVSTLRMLMSALEANAKTKKPRPEINILTNEIKKRLDAATMYSTHGKAHWAAKERLEVSIVREFLPTQLSTDEVMVKIKEASANITVVGMRAMGLYMKALAPIKGQYDGKKLADMVKAHIEATNEQKSNKNKLQAD